MAEGAWQLARLAVKAYCSAALPALDLRGRARMLAALDRPVGGLMEGALPREVRRAFVEHRPDVDDEVLRPVLARCLEALSMPEQLPPLLRQLGHAAALDGRTSVGWPELALAVPLLEEEGAAAAGDALREILTGDAERFAAIAEGLTRLDAAERARRVQLTDDQGAPLFLGTDGQPTHSCTADEPLLSESGRLQYRAPSEMPPDGVSKHFTEAELWSRHFSAQPDGAERMRRWLEDAASRVTVRRPLQPLVATRPMDAERVASRMREAAELRDAVLALRSELEPMWLLDEAPSLWVPLSVGGELRARVRAAQDSCVSSARLLDHLLDAEPEDERPEPPPSSTRWRGLDLSPQMAGAVASESLETLSARIDHAIAVSRWLAGERTAPPTCLASPDLTAACAVRLAGVDVPRSAEHKVAAGLLSAEAIFRRGTAALSALGDGASSDEARRLALDLAITALQRAIDDALTVSSAPRFPEPPPSPPPRATAHAGTAMYRQSIARRVDALLGLASNEAALADVEARATLAFVASSLDAGPDEADGEGWLSPEARRSLRERRASVRPGPATELLDIVLERVGRTADRDALMDAVALRTTLVERTVAGLPELHLGLSWMEERLGCRAHQTLHDLLVHDVNAAIALGLGARRTRQRKDAAGRPLFCGDDGRATVEPTRETLVRVGGEPLFRPPREMSLAERPETFPMRRSTEGFTHTELWERHFVSLPFGERKLEAWVRDVRHIVRRAEDRAPLLDEIDDPPLQPPIAGWQRDLAVLRRTLTELLELPDESPLARPDATDWVKRRVMHAIRQIETARGALPVVPPDARYAGVVASDLPAPVRAEVVTHRAGSLVVRWALARAVIDWLERPTPRPPLDIGWPRTALRETAREASSHVSVDRAAAVCRALFDAEAIAERGAVALSAVASSDDVDGPSTRVAEQLARSVIARALG